MVSTSVFFCHFSNVLWSTSSSKAWSIVILTISSNLDETTEQRTRITYQTVFHYYFDNEVIKPSRFSPLFCPRPNKLNRIFLFSLWFSFVLQAIEESHIRWIIHLVKWMVWPTMTFWFCETLSFVSIWSLKSSYVQTDCAEMFEEPMRMESSFQGVRIQRNLVLGQIPIIPINFKPLLVPRSSPS